MTKEEEEDGIRKLLEGWDDDSGKQRQMAVGNALIPLMEMLGVAPNIPQSRYAVNTYDKEDNACIVKMFWGEFVVIHLPDQGEMKNLWAMLFPVECEEHGVEWVPFPMASTLPHILRTGLTSTINQYLAKQLGEITVPHGTTIN